MKFNLKEIIGTGLLTGYSPIAPGTAGSILALFIYLIPGFSQYFIIIPFIILFFLIGIHLGNYFEKSYGEDPQIFTLDEIVGTWISLLIVPKTAVFIGSAFILWRILDIYKPFPANNAEKLKGGKGIMMDDVVSGMYSLIIIYIFKLLFYQ